MCRKPLLNYTLLRQNTGGEYHFIGNFESVTEDNTLWIKNEGLTAPVSLKNAKTYMMPLTEKKRSLNANEDGGASDFDVSVAELRRLSWNKISALTAGAKVFIGGVLKMVNGQQTFISSKKHPLLIIFYECSERTLGAGVVRAGRYRTEYWNSVTPYAIIGGVFSLIWIAQLFFARPAYRSIVLSAITAIFAPLFPMLPPGLILTIFYRRLWWRACLYRVFRDLALLPLKYMDTKDVEGEGADAGYGCRVCGGGAAGTKVPYLIPADKPEKNEQWYIAGIISGDAVRESDNPFIPYGLLPG
ncbi:MAG: hypothetical protein LBH18_03255, partial [Spirochaetaceae bacterium]|nr:hypothetical protein [Spirochaetaceae bacterium]